MDDVIKLLPDSVANQIAAGEVIQRPASVIKELVENAVDAGATEIKIYIKDAGRTLIQVVDNGKGMSETDARMAFERHATSKILYASDLFTLHTMGFRGEALPSICAISQVELRTKQKDAKTGTRLVIAGSKVELQEPCVCGDGTNIMVKNIFFNVPARRKFLKSDNVELSNIMREFERLALVNHGIRMSVHTGSRELDFRPGSFKQRIGDLWKNNLNMQLLPVEVDTALVKISGFISRPEFARRRNALQYFIVNGRNMKHPYFHRAVMSCFESLIASGTQPCYFLRFEVDPHTIDVNIHPTKSEIKFEYEQQIWPILVAAVRAALGKFSAVPSIDFQSDAMTVKPLAEGEIAVAPRIDIPADYNPFSRYSGQNPHSGNTSRRISQVENIRKEKLKDWTSLYSNFMSDVNNSLEKQAPSVRQESVMNDGKNKVDFECIQVALKYIVFADADELVLVDQYRAHVKILYESYMNHVNDSQLAAQHVMFPDILVLDSSQQNSLREVEQDLVAMGFILKKVGDDSWKITAIPARLTNTDPKDVVLKILDSVSEGSGNYGCTDAAEEHRAMLRKIALLMARSSAVKRGVRLSGREMSSIVAELMELPDPEHTPYGKPVFRKISGSAIEPMF